MNLYIGRRFGRRYFAGIRERITASKSFVSGLELGLLLVVLVAVIKLGPAFILALLGYGFLKLICRGR